MIMEILEEPLMLRKTIAEEEENIREAAYKILSKQYDMIYVTGSGTSYHAGLASQYALSNLANLTVTAIPASEFQYWIPFNMLKKKLLIAISQSGESIDVINACRIALERGMEVIAVTNTPESTLAKMAAHAIFPRSGREIAVPATKSYITQLMAIFLLALEIAAIKRQSLYIEKIRDELYNIPKLIEKIFNFSMERIREKSEKYKDKNPIFILGSGPNYATALEAALKLKETCMVFAEGFAAREFLHGPIRLVDEKSLMILLSLADEVDGYVSLSRSFKGFNANILSVLEENEASKPLIEASDDFFPVPSILFKVFSPILFIVPIQLFTYYMAVFKGLNPDKPEKLVKVVR